MIDYIKYRLRLAKLFKQKERVHALYANKITEAKNESKNQNDIKSLENDSWFEQQMISEEISILVTDYLTKKANRSFIPTPSLEEDGMWEKCNKIHCRYVLSSKGITKLRTSMRIEKKEKYDMLLLLFTTLIGIIGATTGLIAVLLK